MGFSVFSIAFVILSIAFLVWIGRVVYVAFFKHKDEREIAIIKNAMAQTFIAIWVIRLLELIVRVIFNPAWSALLARIDQRIHIEPALVYIVFIGISIFINRSRNSAILEKPE